MTAIIDHLASRSASRARAKAESARLAARRLEAGWALCRILAVAGTTACLGALPAPNEWQGLFLGGLVIAAAGGQRVATLAGAAGTALLIVAPFVDARHWRTGSLALLESWATPGSPDETALRTIAVLAIILLATPATKRTSPKPPVPGGATPVGSGAGSAPGAATAG